MLDKAGYSEFTERFYAAFDDVPTLLRLCSPDVEFRYPAEGQLGYGGTWRGHQAVIGFLQAHDDAEEILDFEPGDMIVHGETVVVFGFFRGRAKPGEHVWTTRFVHAITVRDGLVQRFEAYFDTAAAVQAHRSWREGRR